MKKYKMKINGENYEAKILSYDGTEAKVEVNGVEYLVEIEDQPSSTPVFKKTNKSSSSQSRIQAPVAPISKPSPQSPPSAGSVVAPIPGTVLDIKVNVGDSIEANQVVMIIEAMKMESEIHSSGSGTIKSIKVNKGDSVQEGQLLIEIGA